MSGVLSEVRDLLEQFNRSEWRDLYVRTEGYCVFIAKPGGAGNPMRNSEAAASPSAEAAVSHAVVAPHVGTVISIPDVGRLVEAGAVVGQIQVLDEVFDVRSERGGIIEAVLAPIGTLVQYETPLARIRGSNSSGGERSLHA